MSKTNRIPYDLSDAEKRDLIQLIQAGKDTLTEATTDTPRTLYVCSYCGAAMIIIETFERGQQPRAPPESGAP